MFNPFTVLTSKIFGGLLVAAVAYHVFDEIKDDRKYNEAIAEQNRLKSDNNALVQNVNALDHALEVCNQSKIDAAEIAAAVDDAAREAVRAVRNANQRNLDRIIDGVNSAPAETCEDAEAILRGEAG